jgi:hypothetical protein
MMRCASGAVKSCGKAAPGAGSVRLTGGPHCRSPGPSYMIEPCNQTRTHGGDLVTTKPWRAGQQPVQVRHFFMGLDQQATH